MANGISNLGRALDQISRLKTQQNTMDLLATQLNTGRKTQRFSGLGDDTIVSQRTRANINALDAYMTNITTTDRRIKLMDNSLTQIKEQARSVLGSMQLAVEQGDYENLEVLQGQATAVYDYIVDLVNTQDGERYLFAGADATTKPLNETGQLNSFLGEFVPDETDISNPPLTSSGIIGQWGSGTITTNQFIEAYRGIDEQTLGYSASLANGAAGKVFVRTDDTSQIEYTTLGNSEGIKEILTALSVIMAMPPTGHAPGPLNDTDATNASEDTPPYPSSAKQANFYAVIDDLRIMLNESIEKVTQESFKLAQAQSRMNMIKASHTQEKATLSTIIDNIENVDTTEVAAKITSLQVQIEASYQVTALTSQLTLVNFL